MNKNSTVNMLTEKIYINKNNSGGGGGGAFGDLPKDAPRGLVVKSDHPLNNANYDTQPKNINVDTSNSENSNGNEGGNGNAALVLSAAAIGVLAPIIVDAIKNRYSEAPEIQIILKNMKPKIKQLRLYVKQGKKGTAGNQINSKISNYSNSIKRDVSRINKIIKNKGLSGKAKYQALQRKLIKVSSKLK